MGKIIAIIYGVIAYMFSALTILYAVCFVGNMFVPKSIDSGAETTLLTAIVINVLLLSLFAIQHSIMARPAFKKWITGVISPAIERSTYILISSLVLLLIFWQWHPITTVVWKAENEMIVVILTGVYFFGWLVAFLSTFMISHFELFGLKQVFDNIKGHLPTNPKFQTRLFYKIIRHPIMLGYIIAFWATPTMTFGHLLFSITTTVYILIAVLFFEEKDLRKQIGKEYEDYQKQVPMLVPFTKRAK